MVLIMLFNVNHLLKLIIIEMDNKVLYDWLFHCNPYTNLWSAVQRDNFNELLYEVRQDRGTNIDFSKNFTNIIS